MSVLPSIRTDTPPAAAYRIHPERSEPSSNNTVPDTWTEYSMRPPQTVRLSPCPEKDHCQNYAGHHNFYSPPDSIQRSLSNIYGRHKRLPMPSQCRSWLRGTDSLSLLQNLGRSPDRRPAERGISPSPIWKVPRKAPRVRHI